jgi:hypothetical protein
VTRPKQQRVGFLQLPQGKLVELLVHDRPVEGLAGALVVAVGAHDMKREQLPHRNPALLVLVGRRPLGVGASQETPEPAARG